MHGLHRFFCRECFNNLRNIGVGEQGKYNKTQFIKMIGFLKIEMKKLKNRISHSATIALYIKKNFRNADGFFAVQIVFGQTK